MIFRSPFLEIKTCPINCPASSKEELLDFSDGKYDRIFLCVSCAFQQDIQFF